MWAATCVANLTPRSALNMATPYKALFGKEADLSCLKTIGASVRPNRDKLQEARR